MIAVALAGSGCELVPGMKCSDGCPAEAPCDESTGLCTVPGIRIVQPASDFVGLSVHIVAEMRFREPAQGPLTLDYEIVDATRQLVSSGTLARGAGSAYEATWVPSAEGAFELYVQGAGLGRVSKAITVDQTQPVLSATVGAPARRAAGGLCGDRDPEGGYSNAWRRDEVLELPVTADEPLVPESVELSVVGLNGDSAGALYGPLPVTSIPAGACGAPYCGTVSVDLSKPEFRAFRGPMTLQLSGTDLAGNPGTGSENVNVTRWKWRCLLAGNGRAFAAMGNGGVVYVPATVGGDAGIAAVTPDGVLAWHRAVGEIAGGLAVAAGPDGGEEIYANQFSAAEDAGYLLALDADGGVAAALCGPYGRGMSDSIALLRWPDSDPQTVPVTIAGQGGGTLVAATRGSDAGCYGRPNVGMPPPGGSISARADAVYFSDSNPGIQTQAWTFLGTSWVPASTWPLVNVAMPSIAFSTSGLVGAGQTSTDGGLLLVDYGGPGGGGVRMSTSTAGAEAYHLALDGTLEAVFGDSSGALYRARPGSPPTAVLTDAGTYPAAPALGDDGRAYAVNGDGVLIAFQPSLEPEWAIPLDAAGASPPLLDCPRDAGVPLAGRPGAAYVVTGSGALDAFVVDSRAPDSTALWSRYRHDVRNTANRDWPLACP